MHLIIIKKFRSAMRAGDKKAEVSQSKIPAELYLYVNVFSRNLPVSVGFKFRKPT